MDRVAAAIADLGLPPARLERLKTAVSETAMNAIEYGSQGDPDVPVDIVVETTRRGRSSCASPTVRCPAASPASPRRPIIERKLAGEQKPRGWGLFLIKSMVDSMDVTSDGIDPDGDPDDGARGATDG